MATEGLEENTAVRRARGKWWEKMELQKNSASLTRFPNIRFLNPNSLFSFSFFFPSAQENNDSGLATPISKFQCNLPRISSTRGQLPRYLKIGFKEPDSVLFL
jgi:hypothetical protein